MERDTKNTEGQKEAFLPLGEVITDPNLSDEDRAAMLTALVDEE